MLGGYLVPLGRGGSFARRKPPRPRLVLLHYPLLLNLGDSWSLLVTINTLRARPGCPLAAAARPDKADAGVPSVPGRRGRRPPERTPQVSNPVRTRISAPAEARPAAPSPVPDGQGVPDAPAGAGLDELGVAASAAAAERGDSLGDLVRSRLPHAQATLATQRAGVRLPLASPFWGRGTGPVSMLYCAGDAEGYRVVPLLRSPNAQPRTPPRPCGFPPAAGPETCGTRRRFRSPRGRHRASRRSVGPRRAAPTRSRRGRRRIRGARRSACRQGARTDAGGAATGGVRAAGFDALRGRRHGSRRSVGPRRAAPTRSRRGRRRIRGARRSACKQGARTRRRGAATGGGARRRFPMPARTAPRRPPLNSPPARRAHPIPARATAHPRRTTVCLQTRRPNRRRRRGNLRCARRRFRRPRGRRHGSRRSARLRRAAPTRSRRGRRRIRGARRAACRQGARTRRQCIETCGARAAGFDALGGHHWL